MRYKALFIGGAGILGNEIIKSKFFKKIYGTQDQNPSFSGKKTDQNLSKSIKKNNITLPNHGKIYLTAFKSFNENKFLGNGLKSFRYECKKFLNLPNTLCSTHPIIIILRFYMIWHWNFFYVYFCDKFTYKNI